MVNLSFYSSWNLVPPLTQGLDDIPKHETSSCSQSPYIVDEEKANRIPYMACVLWLRKEHKCLFALVVLDLGVKSWEESQRNCLLCLEEFNAVIVLINTSQQPNEFTSH